MAEKFPRSRGSVCCSSQSVSLSAGTSRDGVTMSADGLAPSAYRLRTSREVLAPSPSLVRLSAYKKKKGAFPPPFHSRSCAFFLEVEPQAELEGPRDADELILDCEGLLIRERVDSRRRAGAVDLVVGADAGVLPVAAVEALGEHRHIAGSDVELLRKPHVERPEIRQALAVAAEMDTVDGRPVGAR